MGKGGIIGKPNEPTSTTAKGIWSLREQYNAQKNSVWPGTSNFIKINDLVYDLNSLGSVSITTSGLYTFSVLGKSNLRFELWGAGGGGGESDSGYTVTRGGAGGYVSGEISLSSGINYSIIIAQGGFLGTGNSVRAYPDGGGSNQSYGSPYRNGTGGGSTRFGPLVTSGNENVVTNTFYLIAGGGGGGITASEAGTYGMMGGGTNGVDGGRYYTVDGPSAFGKGGTQSAGGAAGTGGRIGTPQAGAKYLGGHGFAGGGGGYYGGGGGMGYFGAGGGGSGYFDPSIVVNGTFATATTGVSTYYISPNPLGTRPTATTGYGGAAYGGTGGSGAIVITAI